MKPFSIAARSALATLLTCVALADDAGTPEPAPLERGLRRVPTAAPSLPEPDWSAVTVSLYIVATTRAGAHALVDDGAVLHTGDQLAFFLKVGAPTYVLLLQVDARGEVQFLHPESGEAAQLLPGREYRFPEGSFTFELDAHSGDERIVLLASRQPLAKVDRKLSAVLEEVRKSARWPGVTPVDPLAQHPGPTRLSPLTRGGVKLDTATGRSLELIPNARGVAFRTLTLHHLP